MFFPNIRSFPLYQGAPWQPSLGAFSCLPPEIRDMIWLLCLQSVVPIDHSIKDRDPDSVPITQFMIIYTSRQLSDEITDIYYAGPRDLTVCLGLPDYDLGPERQAGRYTNYHIDFNGIIRSRDLANTDFSFFTSINLQIELAIKGTRTRTARLNSLKCFVAEFSELVQEWQSRKPWWSITSCPRIDVVVDIPPEKTDTFSWEIDLRKLADLLKPLGDIDNCGDATIDFRGELLCGREWVPEIFGQITTNMKQEGKDFEWLGENIVDAMIWSSEDTQRVQRRVTVLARREETRRWSLIEGVMRGGDEEDRKGRKEQEELRMLLLGTLPCRPANSQSDSDFINSIERYRAKHTLNRIFVMVILLDLLILDMLWTSFWAR